MGLAQDRNCFSSYSPRISKRSLTFKCMPKHPKHA